MKRQSSLILTDEKIIRRPRVELIKANGQTSTREEDAIYIVTAKSRNTGKQEQFQTNPEQLAWLMNHKDEIGTDFSKAGKNKAKLRMKQKSRDQSATSMQRFLANKFCQKVHDDERVYTKDGNPLNLTKDNLEVR